MKRRNFLATSSAATTALLLFPGMAPNSAHKNLKTIGVQLFSLPKILEKDFRGGIRALSEMGYKEIEMYGPYPFSVDSVKERWNSLAPRLGFSGSGYFGHTPKEVSTILKEYGIKATSIHTDMETLQTRMQQLGEAADQIGFEYVGLPAIPEEKRKTLDDYKIVAEEFNTIGEQAKKVGLKFAYHNHGYGLQDMDGQIPLQLLLEQTDPSLVFFELDIFWTTAGSADPIHYLKSYPDRYHLMHIKDMKEEVRFSGDGGNPMQWMELFPYMTTAGSGVIDIPSIVSVAEKAGVKHFYVEQDFVKDPEIALKKSFDYLKSIKLKAPKNKQ
ncbi:sugar phosphate isomerase/epimerase [uncultured Eudoraea sp.]|uniref:sugar phosphate isomerase/epimerase family protein n=1 Tax=uncultured Eudoraea sp. TaxID=1035614 RepID=UPI00261411E4|nr:sugar phosphate isomerase/epimerase [uncultured Eudoraea sp.]